MQKGDSRKQGDGDTALHQAVRHASKKSLLTLLDATERDGRLRVEADTQNEDGVGEEVTRGLQSHT